MTGMSTAREMAWAAASVGAARSIAPWMPPLQGENTGDTDRASVNTHLPHSGDILLYVWPLVLIKTDNLDAKQGVLLLALVRTLFSVLF